MPTTPENLGPGSLLGQLGKRLRQAESALREATSTAEGLREQIVVSEKAVSASALRDMEQIRDLQDQVERVEAALLSEKEAHARSLKEKQQEVVQAQASATAAAESARALEEQLESRTQRTAVTGIQGESKLKAKYEERIVSLQAELADLRGALERRVAAHKEWELATEQNSRSLSTAKQEAEARVAELERELAEMHTRSELAVQLADERAEAATFKAEQAAAERDRSTSDLEELRALRGQKSQREADMNAAVEAAEQRAARAEQLAQRMETLAEKAREETATAQAALSLSTQALEHRQAEIQRLEDSQHADADKQVSVVRAELEKSQRNLEAERQEARRLLAEARQATKVAEEATEGAQAHAAELRGEVAAAKEEADQLRASNQHGTEQLAEREKELQAVTEARDQLSQRLAEAERRTRVLEQEVEDAKESRQRAGALARLGQEE